MYIKHSKNVEGVYVSADFNSQISLSCFLSDTWFQSWVPNAKPTKKHNFELFLIFTSPYLKIYFCYVYATFRDNRRSVCLCIFQISDHYLFFLVSHMISKLGSGRETTQYITISSFFSSSLVHNSKYICAMYMRLSETIEGVYVSPYFQSQTFIYLYSLFSHRIYKLESRHAKHPIWAIFSFSSISRSCNKLTKGDICLKFEKPRNI